MADKTNFSGVASKPLKGWADPWESPVKHKDKNEKEKTAKGLARSIQMKSKAKVFVEGGKFSFGVTGIKGRGLPQGSSSATVSKSSSQSARIGNQLDMYL
ncbi:MAG: hypothetical protein P9L92_15180 [Candidatus Electryonea clarkiae]|nr:hypothetical protein [Candidatus Electryonea clarkiae]MDP8287523.1 hypothetical protein [Candidatus Electryonea clarkiae]